MSQLESVITKAWQQQSWWLWIFYPLTVIYGIIIKLRHLLYRLGIFSSYRAPIPVMIIGNITVGGSGKTPLIIELVTYLQNKSQNNPDRKAIKVGVISRGYGGDSKAMPCLVKPNSLPQTVGDEPCLIVQQTHVAMCVGANRQQAIERLLSAYPDLQLIISDDGLQHYALQRDIEWIVVDASRGFGNKQLLPVGYLREPLARLQNSTVIWHKAFICHKPSSTNNTEQSNTNNSSESSQHNAYTMTLMPDTIVPLTPSSDLPPIPAQAFCDSHPVVYGVSGIGYPIRFFNTLRDIGFDVIEMPFDDHHTFIPKDFADLTQYPILVTSKDAVKIRQLAKQNPTISRLPIWVLPVNAKLSPSCYELLDKQLHKVGVL